MTLKDTYQQQTYISSRYNFAELEQKWQDLWHNHNVFAADNNFPLPKYYVLEMFPYPSGKIHIGHVRNYAIGDVVARFKRAKGFNVLHPMGWDAFGLPAENAAKEQNISPISWTYSNIKSMKSDLRKIGLSIDWSREVITSDPEYYQHEQKMFIDFYNMGLAYKKETLVNWDPVEETVLANEQVVDGKGWRSGAVVEQKTLKQWFLKITDFAEELLAGLDTLSNWPQQVVTMQKNWIGKSEGVVITFNLLTPLTDITTIDIFTTRPDTLFGASFVAISINHPLSQALAIDNPEVASFIEEINRDNINKVVNVKKGIDTGLWVRHPLIQNHTLPVYIANFVLDSYGCGAIFGVPAHDNRDFDFAKKYNLAITTVVAPADNLEATVTDQAFTEDGVMVNSAFLDGMTTQKAKEVMVNYLTDNQIGFSKTNYLLRDWGVSRQRYWGCPIPIVYCETCGMVPEAIDNLPVTLPTDIDFTNLKGNPLDSHPTWKFTTCPQCHNNAVRETDTFDTFMESSWYFLKYTTTDPSIPFARADIDQWLPVDHYIGGIEHAILHLLYARFFVKALNKANYFDTLKEPFTALTTQGMICHKTYKTASGEWVFPTDVQRDQDNNLIRISTKEIVFEGPSEKMSKSKKNVVSPEYICNTYGADTARLFVLSDSPPTKDLEWTEEGVEAVWKFINRLWICALELKDIPYCEKFDLTSLSNIELTLLKFTHKTIKDVESNIDVLLLNKAIANNRELFNLIVSTKKKLPHNAVVKFAFCTLIRLLNPFIPHITEEVWQIFGFSNMLAVESWTTYNPDLLKEDTVDIAVQVLGKTRGVINIPIDYNQEQILQIIQNNPKIYKFFENQAIKKVIYVKAKIINIIV